MPVFIVAFLLRLGEATAGNAVKDGVGGLTLSQLYSTASYQDHDLQGIGLDINDLTGVNFANQNLFKATFSGCAVERRDLQPCEPHSDGFLPCRFD